MFHKIHDLSKNNISYTIYNIFVLYINIDWSVGLTTSNICSGQSNNNCQSSIEVVNTLARSQLTIKPRWDPLQIMALLSSAVQVIVVVQLFTEIATLWQGRS